MQFLHIIKLQEHKNKNFFFSKFFLHPEHIICPFFIKEFFVMKSFIGML